MLSAVTLYVQLDSKVHIFLFTHVRAHISV